MAPLIDADVTVITETLKAAGIEVYRVVDSEIQIAERVRLHIMDSGVRVETGAELRIVFCARSQRSDYPHMGTDELIGLVRNAIGQPATGQGFVEHATASREIRDPSTQEQVLDVWHEITYAKTLVSVDSLVDDLRWALSLDKYVCE